MGRRTMSICGLDFSWMHATGVPSTGVRRQRGMGKWIRCCAPLGVFLTAALASSTALGHSGGLDEYGGHMNHKTGKYHFHREHSNPTSRSIAPSRSTAPRAPNPSTSPSSSRSIGYVRPGTRIGSGADSTTSSNVKLAPGWAGQADAPTDEESRLGTYGGKVVYKRRLQYGDPVAKGEWADEDGTPPQESEDPALPLPRRADPDRIVYSQEKSSEFHWTKDCSMAGGDDLVSLTHAEAKEAKFFACGVCQRETSENVHPSKRIPKPLPVRERR